METILDDLITDGTTPTNEADRSYYLQVLEETLQSETRDYTKYFSSRAVDGSIVEDIAELDAEISILERNVKSVLVSNKDTVKQELFGKSEGVVMLEGIKESLEQLWEIDNSESKSEVKKTGDSNDELSIEEFLESKDQELMVDGSGGKLSAGNDNKSGGSKADGNDEFHKALRRLRSRISQGVTNNNNNNNNNNNSSNNTNAGTNTTTNRLYAGSNGLASVLENLPSIIDLMELPSLARICIRTGHYQEAIMLFTHTNTLRLKFPESVIVDKICDSVANEITTTMQTGLVKLLATNLSVNSMKKILKYLGSIPPFYKQANLTSWGTTDSTDFKTQKIDDSLLLVFLEMRARFIENEVMSYSIDNSSSSSSSTSSESSSGSSLEIAIKSQIEVIREHIYMSLTTFMKSNEVNLTPISIPINHTLLQTEIITNANDNKPFEFHNSQTPTSLPMLQFVNRCLSFLLSQIKRQIKQNKRDASPSKTNTDSICLQLVYCSFRLNDLNPNYHNLFLNKILETELFSVEQIIGGIVKRCELASRFSLT